ncbi:Bifunctional protein HldE [Sporomusa ovata DSM 2662]|uniref:ADP-heptose synthase / D-glycero-beta-D-manno-heptose 7-phosphate kinase n=1 Tax=Sporomusa ovata TaxID=2378 RepID=A0A0U1KT02_9FIRM|nr:PfkB family carbohydrate kinase [Sporomusa ovata]EQB26476.1 bifunctional protein HldE [Sporomusa ovata DSM 2662]CQR70560.1 ADP-heptose synthase / D-glycero-beta-D-manno-heptose 7-phosphate kinase [Sporomusa ovata]
MSRNLVPYIDKLQDQKIMIIGDMVADVYLEGKIARISREAPVLILEHSHETVVPGGAANAVNNAAALGGQVYAVGVVGPDNAGEQLSHSLRDKKVNTDGLFIDTVRPTITKTRIMAGGQATVRQQIVRIDRESKEPLDTTIEQKLLTYIEATMQTMSAVIISDYGSMTISPAIREQVISACNRAGIPSIVDSRYDIMAYEGIRLVKQNESEAAAATGLKMLNGSQVQQTAELMLAKLKAEVILITQGPDGMTLFNRNGTHTHIPVTNMSEVYDVTGAGDTVVATMMLALAAGADYIEAACLANFAAGVVVRKPGTATTSPQELKAAIGEYYE